MDELKLCPFCGGKGRHNKGNRDGYEDWQDDPDAYAHWIVCRSCAATGGWSKSETGAVRMWNLRPEAFKLLIGPGRNQITTVPPLVSPAKELSWK